MNEEKAAELTRLGTSLSHFKGIQLMLRGNETAAPQDTPHVLRTTDRAIFRRCRRKWYWTSHTRANRSPMRAQDPLWFGTGFHYALDDFHGVNVYGSVAKAFAAYVEGCRLAVLHHKELGLSDIETEFILPPTWEEHRELGILMAQYYEDYWLRYRDPLKTFVWNGEPQCEVDFEVTLPIKARDGRPIVYRGRLDRVVVDQDGLLWILEYKTAKEFRLYHLDTDDQITSYCWAVSILYGQPVAGVIYMQFKKAYPKPPRVLKTKGGALSVAKNQNTTAHLYRDALIEKYGSMENAPAENVEFYNYLLTLEHEEGDKFIRRDYVYRNRHQIEAQGVKILLEAEDMTNPDLPLYPNPNKDCDWDCPVQAVCIALDDGSDWQSLLEETTVQNVPYAEPWRPFLPAPESIQLTKPDPEALDWDIFLDDNPDFPNQEQES